MAVARRPEKRLNKKARISAHIEDLKRLIQTAHPEARFEVAPVPESRWPGLWVYADFDDLWDIFDLVGDAQDEFMGKELMAVHVMPQEPNGSGN